MSYSFNQNSAQDAVDEFVDKHTNSMHYTNCNSSVCLYAAAFDKISHSHTSQARLSGPCRLRALWLISEEILHKYTEVQIQNIGLRLRCVWSTFLGVGFLC